MEVTRCTRLDPRSCDLLLRTAAAAIEAGLLRPGSHPPDPAGLPGELRADRASFVTLTIEGRLRGCCGSLEPRRPLATDVWDNAAASAFRDPRFEPLHVREWPQVDLEVSVLAPLERVVAGSEAELLGRLRPGEDGLVIAWRGTRATFLPKVWQQIGEPREFLRHLKQKAGWRDDFWAVDVEAWRYTTQCMTLDRPALHLAAPSR